MALWSWLRLGRRRVEEPASPPAEPPEWPMWATEQTQVLPAVNPDDPEIVRPYVIKECEG